MSVSQVVSTNDQISECLPDAS